RRPAVQEPLEPDERTKDERTLQRPELDRGLGPDVAELEDERDAKQATQDVRGNGHEELRRGPDDDIRSPGIDSAQSEGRKEKRQEIQDPPAEPLVRRRVEPGPHDVDSIDRLPTQPFAFVTRMDHSVRMIREAGDDRDVVPQTNPFTRVLVCPDRGSIGLWREILANYRDLHSNFSRPSPRRTDPIPARLPRTGYQWPR